MKGRATAEHSPRRRYCRKEEFVDAQETFRKLKLRSYIRDGDRIGGTHIWW
jgi:hypothetical protein